MPSEAKSMAADMYMMGLFPDQNITVLHRTIASLRMSGAIRVLQHCRARKARTVWKRYIHRSRSRKSEANGCSH